ARGLRQRLVGREVRGVEVGWARSLANLPPEAAESFLVGRRIEAVGRRGKLVLLHLDDGAALAIHRRMSGNLLVERAAEPRHRHTRFVLRLDRGLELRFVDARKFGRLLYFADESALREYLSRAVGAEPLEGLDAERLAALLGGRRGRLKAMLLDQRVLAGIGNIYADEILWRARLHPGRSVAGLEPGELLRLAEAIDSVLRVA